MASQASLSFIPLASWAKAAARCGFAIEPVLREIGVATRHVGPHGVTITLEQARRLIEACIERTQGEHFPFVFGESFALDAVPEIEAYVLTSATLRNAIRSHNWVRALMGPTTLRVTLHEAGEVAQLRIDSGRKRERPLATVWFIESTVASILKLIRTLLGRQHAQQLLFCHAAPAYARSYHRFFGVEAAFEQPFDAIVLPRELLDRPLHGALPDLHRQAEERIRHFVSGLPTGAGLAAQIERMLLDHPALFEQGIEQCAARLGMQLRTLQRRLQDEGEAFSELQARTRFRLACTLLRDTPLALEAISERLGFSDRRAFTRAFSRRAGRSPSAFRQGIADDRPAP